MSVSGSPRLEPGYRLDRYELLCPIAQGGMASVWLARLHGKHGFEKLVAIKTILQDRAEEARFRDMFLDEARIASRIEHANVAHIHDLGEQDGILYLVMEWVDGDSLSKLCRAAERRGRRLPVGVAMRIVADAASGLHAAHELRDPSGLPLSVVHRDVSPQNILVSAQGNAKLIDFGIAKAVNRLSKTLSAAGPALKGKIGYMAPEQATGQELDRRTDVWALGAVLYFLFAGKPPFEGPNEVATLYELTRGKPPPALPASVPEPIRRYVFELVAHAPAARPQSAEAVHKRLEALLVECRIPTSTADVATFVRDQLSERAEARRKAVAMAIDAANDRAKIEGLVGDGGPEVPTAFRPLSAPVAFAPLASLSPGGSDPRMITSATLGSAVVAYPNETTVTDLSTKRLLAMVIGVASALGVVLLVLLATWIIRRQDATATAPTAPETLSSDSGVAVVATPTPVRTDPKPTVLGVVAGTHPTDEPPPAPPPPSEVHVRPETHPATDVTAHTTKPSTGSTTKPRGGASSTKGTGTVDDGF